MSEGQTPVPDPNQDGAQERPAKDDDYAPQHDADPVAGDSMIPDEEREISDRDTLR